MSIEVRHHPAESLINFIIHHTRLRLPKAHDNDAGHRELFASLLPFFERQEEAHARDLRRAQSDAYEKAAANIEAMSPDEISYEARRAAMSRIRSMRFAGDTAPSGDERRMVVENEMLRAEVERVRAEEREACAAICEQDECQAAGCTAGLRLAARIRARGAR